MAESGIEKDIPIETFRRCRGLANDRLQVVTVGQRISPDGLHPAAQKNLVQFFATEKSPVTDLFDTFGQFDRNYIQIAIEEIRGDPGQFFRFERNVPQIVAPLERIRAYLADIFGDFDPLDRTARKSSLTDNLKTGRQVNGLQRGAPAEGRVAELRQFIAEPNVGQRRTFIKSRRADRSRPGDIRPGQKVAAAESRVAELGNIRQVYLP